jgi:hypothetical protein
MLAAREPRRPSLPSSQKERGGDWRGGAEAEGERQFWPGQEQAWTGWGKAGATYQLKFLFWSSRGEARRGEARGC